ncbi:MAG: hypothetical protein EOP84_07040 [Verrucomicrobiaceae bacterium]|nr:MAG: hypothetical protein EOP84_07040 [Verrucomicrobiaceae bacterium]
MNGLPLGSLGLLLLVFLGMSGGTINAAPPANDDPENATVLTGETGAFTFDLTDSFRYNGEYSIGGSPAGSVWFQYTAPRSGHLSITYQRFTEPAGDLVFLTPYLQTQVDPPRFLPFLTDSIFAPPIGLESTVSIPTPVGETRFLQFAAPGLPGSAQGTASASFKLITGGAFEAYAGVYRENDGTVTISVRRDSGSDEASTVEYAITGGLATAGVDYTVTGAPVSGTLVFPPGISQQNLVIDLLQDANPEGSESIEFSISNPSTNALLGDQISTTLVIQDDEGNAANDDFANRATLTGATGVTTLPEAPATQEPSEPSHLQSTLWYTWTAPSDGVLTLTTPDWALPAFTPSLYTGSSLDLLTQVRPIDILFPFIVDSAEASHSFVVQAGTVYQIAIENYDSAAGPSPTLTHEFDATGSVFRFARARVPVVEGKTATVEVTRLGSKSGLVAVDIRLGFLPSEGGLSDTTPSATAGTDYAILPGTVLVFEDGEASKTVSIETFRDKQKEGEEHFRVLMGIISGGGMLDYPAGVSVDIQETKAPVPVRFAPCTVSGRLAPTGGAATGNGHVTFTIPATGRFTGALTVDGNRYTLRGALPPLEEQFEGQASETTLTVGPRSNPVAVKLRYEWGFDGPIITGTVSDGSFTSTFAPSVPLLDLDIVPARVDGMYSVALVPNANVPASVNAPGFFTLKVAPNGSAKISGRLPDGTAVTSKGYVTFQASGGLAVSFCAPLYGKGGYLTGEINLSFPGGPGATGGDGGGELTWLHPQRPSGPAKTAFLASFDCLVSRYAPANSLALKVTPATALEVKLSGAGIANTTIPFKLLAKSKVAIPKGTEGKPKISIKAA